jgi:hypothetical protein
MSIEVRHERKSWHLVVTPPDVVEPRNATVATATEVLATLSSWGCQLTDAARALDSADLEWTRSHDEEILRRRWKSSTTG